MSRFATLADIPNPAMREQARRKLEHLRKMRRLAAERDRRAKHPPRAYEPGKKIPKTPKAVMLMRVQLLQAGLLGWKEEHRFHPTRFWRFDFAQTAGLMLAVEIEGLTFKGGRHQRFKGFNEDCRKYLAAMVLGWRVIRVTPLMVRTGEAITAIVKIAKGEGTCSHS